MKTGFYLLDGMPFGVKYLLKRTSHESLLKIQRQFLTNFQKFENIAFLKG